MAEDKKMVKEENVEEVVATPVEAPKAEEKKTGKKEKEVKPELEREYIIPVRKQILKSPRYRRARKAVNTVKAFLARHMHVEGRDTRLIKIDRYLNEAIWSRGVKKPMTKIHVKAKKIDGVVYVELAEMTQKLQFKKDKEVKFHSRISSIGAKKPKVSYAKKEEQSLESKADEKEKEKATAEAGDKEKKMEAKVMKRETGGAHAKKTQPRRQALKK